MSNRRLQAEDEKKASLGFHNNKTLYNKERSEEKKYLSSTEEYISLLHYKRIILKINCYELIYNNLLLNFIIKRELFFRDYIRHPSHAVNFVDLINFLKKVK